MTVRPGVSADVILGRDVAPGPRGPTADSWTDRSLATLSWAGSRQPRAARCSVAVRRAAGSPGASRGRRRSRPPTASAAGRWSVTRRAERVSRPARPNSRRRSVFVVTIPSPRPIRAVQRARLWAITWTASQAPLAANLPGRQVVEADPVLEVADRVLDLGVAAVVGLEDEGLAVAVGDEGVVVVQGEEAASWEPGVGAPGAR